MPSFRIQSQRELYMVESFFYLDLITSLRELGLSWTALRNHPEINASKWSIRYYQWSYSDPVIRKHHALSVELEPGIMDTIFDGWYSAPAK